MTKHKGAQEESAASFAIEVFGFVDELREISEKIRTYGAARTSNSPEVHADHHGYAIVVVAAKLEWYARSHLARNACLVGLVGGVLDGCPQLDSPVLQEEVPVPEAPVARVVACTKRIPASEKAHHLHAAAGSLEELTVRMIASGVTSGERETQLVAKIRRSVQEISGEVSGS